MEPFVGQIIPVGFNFAPPGWFMCQGQIVPIDQYQTLYALIGSTYGGDGQVTFGIPNLQGRVPLHQGQGSGLSNYFIGEVTGTESVTLLSNQIGAHTHSFMTSGLLSTTITPGPTTALGIAGLPDAINAYFPAPSNATLAPTAIGQAGGSIPHENRQPFLALNFIIAWAGIFPSRN